MSRRFPRWLGAALVFAGWLLPSAWRLASAACPEGTSASEHVVADDETLSEIALREGVSVRSILNANPRVEAKFIRPGQRLTLCKASAPPRAAKPSGGSCGGGMTVAHHTVSKGETLSAIARRYGVGADAIVRRNAALRSDRDALRVGQDLLICADTRRSKASKSCDYRSPVHRHRVVPGEHAAQIAGRYGVSRRELYRLNPGLAKNPDLLRPGQDLLVCPNIAPRERTRLVHAVQPGETLGSIALRYKVTPRELELYQQGKLADRNALRVGQELVVWRDGAVVPGFGVDDDDTGVLPGGMQLPPGRNYVVKNPALSWGTEGTVLLIQSAISRYRAKFANGPKVHVGDISRRGGGKFPPHVSHQHGRDVDVGYVLRGELAHETRFHNANAGNLDLARTWALVRAFVDTDEVRYVFMDRKIQKLLYDYALAHGMSEDALDVYFEYPHHRSHGIIRHSKGHVNHFHVRFTK